MKIFLTRLAFMTCAAIAGFAMGRISKQCSVTIPAYQAAQFYLSADMKELTMLKDTTNIRAVEGLRGDFEHREYKLDSITFNVYYFRTGWTAYIKTGGYVPDTTLFIKYRGEAVCVSPAVDRLFIKKFLR